MLTGAVFALCSFAWPLRNATDTAANGRRDSRTHQSNARESRALRIFEKHQLALRDSIVRAALAQVGTPYEFGGNTPDQGFDCSGLVRFVFSPLYMTPPRLAANQARIGAAVGRDRLSPGDLVTFGAGDSVTHIGIYVGDRKFVHASVKAGRVIVSSIENPHSELIQVLKGGRRVLPIAEPSEQRFAGS
jgi:cell wall-associated NlpC family hydrolase